MAVESENGNMENIDKQIQRATWHDYYDEGYYMLTLVTTTIPSQDGTHTRRMQCFGQLAGDSEYTATIVLTPLGKTLEDAINDIPHFYPDIEVIDYIVMPDHCHICLHVSCSMQKHLGLVVRGIKYATSVSYLNELNTRYGGTHRTTLNAKGYRDGSTIINQVQGERNATIAKTYIVRDGIPIQKVIHPLDGKPIEMTIVPPLWAQGYHDRIVTRYGQITAIRNYIHRNVARLWLKRNTMGGMMRNRMTEIPLSWSLAQRIKDYAVYWDSCRQVQHSAYSHRHDGTHYGDSYTQLTSIFLRKRADQPFIRVKACGNSTLLESGRPLVRVRVSRSVTERQFYEELDRILTLCEKEGAIPISPFLSWSEKEILLALRQNQYQHIIIHGEAMSDLWKPSDQSFCNHHQTMPLWYTNSPLYRKLHTTQTGSDITLVRDGQALFLAPWHERPRSQKPGKPDCELMNEMCAAIEQGHIIQE